MNQRVNIDLAPGHKLGLVAPSPVLLAGGIVGLGEAVPTGVDTSRLGGVVVGPIQRHPRVGTAPPRLAEAPGQFVLDLGLQNRGLNATLKRYARHWSRLGCPVIVQLADTEVHFLGHVATRLMENEQVSGFELLVPPHLHGHTASDQAGGNMAEWLTQALHVINQNSDLPIWVKLPLTQAVALGQHAVAAGAAGLVVGQLPVGMLGYHPMHRMIGNLAHNGYEEDDYKQARPEGENTLPSAADALLRGALYGPSIFPLMLTALVELAQQTLPTALIACGGIHTVAQARQALAAGASAVQLDSAVWIEPGIVGMISDGL